MAVSVKNLCFGYKNNLILNNLNLHIERGIIFGLLGPSGCGKTTLLKTIIGLLQPSRGEIKIFGFTPGTDECGIPGNVVGFMPQELAVQLDLTIEEIFKYFGIIYGMEKDDVKREMDKLIKLLELPDKKRLVGQMSGGQIRRTSLAITLLHKPRLIILDEPTVGVDPVLTEVIWNLMIDLSSNQGLTIIITTHYIEETKRATAVGFMRKGEILEQNYPNRLLEKYNCRKLDDVFLTLCTQQKQSRKEARKKGQGSYYRKVTSKDDIKSNAEIDELVVRLQPKFKLSNFINTITATIWKYNIEIIRNPIAVLLGVVMMISCLLPGKIFYGMVPEDIPVAWIVDGKTQIVNYTNCFHENITVELALPEILKQSINKKIIKLIDYDNIETAVKDTKKRKLVGIIHLSKNFSESFLDSDLLFSCRDGEVEDEVVKSGSINLILDYTTRVMSDTVRAVMEKAVLKFRDKIGDKININKILMKPQFEFIELKENEEIPMRIDDEGVNGSTSFISPGILACNLFVFGFVMSMCGKSYDKETDMSLRCFAAGVRAEHTLAGQIIARFVWMIPALTSAILLMIYGLGITCKGSLVIVFILSFIIMLLGLVSGALFSIGVNKSHVTFNLLIFISIGIMCSNSILWATVNQPYYLKWITDSSPITAVLTALRAELNKSKTPFSTVFPAYVLLSSWTILCFFLAFVTLKKRQR